MRQQQSVANGVSLQCLQLLHAGEVAALGTRADTAAPSLSACVQLVDVNSLTSLKTYKTGRYVQSAAISPTHDHVLMGGGQDASQVGHTGSGSKL